jgi:hypothetical protein
MSEPTVQKLSFFEKAGYSLGDGAANFVFQTMILFQLNFYTDTMGIVAGVAGSLLLVGRLWDAFFDPMMGLMADRTNTRWGKFRPWVLWTAVPWGVVMVVAYTTPNFSAGGKMVYACVTNMMLMTLYSANNTPYSAMTGVMTGDVNERTSLSSFRFVSAMIAQLIVGGFTLPLVAKFGQGDNAKGWQMTMGLWATICVVLFIITFPHHARAHSARPQTKARCQAGFPHSRQDRPLGRHVHPHAGPLLGPGHARRHALLLLPVLRGSRSSLRSAANRRPGQPRRARRLVLPVEHVRPGGGFQARQRVVGGLQPVQYVEPVRHRPGRAVLHVPLGEVRQEGGGHRRVLADYRVHGVVRAAAARCRRVHLPAGVRPRAYLRSHHSADLVDVRRRGGLLRSGRPAAASPASSTPPSCSD